MTQRFFAGQTMPGKTPWLVYDNRSIRVVVDTSAAQFKSQPTPIYVCSIGGANDHWATVGSDAVYDPTNTSFQVYLRRTDNCPLTPDDANHHEWHINWIGVQNDL